MPVSAEEFINTQVNGVFLKEAERKFKALAEGGSTNMPFGKTFFSKGFGMCVDRFGIPWMVNAPLEGM